MPAALDGLRVLDLTDGIAGPFCTKLLADYGADVIKIEKPGSGDWTRQRPPFYKDQPHLEYSLLFAYLNTSKRSVSLDIDSDFGRETVRQLAGNVDVLVTSRPLKSLDALEGGREGLKVANPKLVVTAVPYFEGDGPYAGFKATELTLYAMSGLMALASGDRRGRLMSGGYQAQYMAGIQACSYTLFGVYQARASGKGSFIETSVIESCAKVLAHMQEYVPDSPRRPTNQVQEGSVWPCKEGAITVMMYYFQMETLGKLIGDPSLRSDTGSGADIGMRDNQQVWREPLRSWLQTKTADEAQWEGQKEHLLFNKVNSTRDVVESEHLNARQFFTEVDHPVMGPAKYPTGPFHLTGGPRGAPRPAPALGEGNNDVLTGELAHSAAELDDLLSAGVI